MLITKQLPKNLFTFSYSSSEKEQLCFLIIIRCIYILRCIIFVNDDRCFIFSRCKSFPGFNKMISLNLKMFHPFHICLSLSLFACGVFRECDRTFFSWAFFSFHIAWAICILYNVVEYFVNRQEKR